MSELSSHQIQNESRFAALLITLIVFLNIIVDQSINTIIIESIRPLDASFKGVLTPCYMALSVIGSLFLAGWSDFHCRRKTVIFALVFAILSFVCMAGYKLWDIHALGVISLAIKALLGSVTPICFAILADIIKTKNFRNVLALAIVSYSIGIWIPIYFRSSIEAESNFLIFFVPITIVATIGTILFVKDDKFDHVKFFNNPANFKSFVIFFKTEMRLIVLFLMSSVIAPAMLCYFFGEVSYYQFLLRGELIANPDFYAFQALVLATGYYIGTVLLLVLGWFKIKDMTCIKIGLLTSLFSSGAIIFVYYSSYSGYVQNALVSLFSIGFSLVTPSLFACMSKISHAKEQGKIYGALDSTDTFAELSSTLIIKRTEFSPIYLILLFSFLIFSLSCTLFLRFLRKYAKVSHTP